MKVKASIYVTQRQNDKLFGQKLCTFTWGFCRINRTVTIGVCPDGIYTDEGEYGHIVVNGQNVPVLRIKEGDWEIAIH